MRIAVKGTSGSGKTTTAGLIASRLGLPHIELDALNWGPDWQSRSDDDPAEFRRRVEEATSSPAWVICGGYYGVNDLVLGRASHCVWLDYSRTRVMRQVVSRSFWRAWRKQEVWPGTGNRESFRSWLEPDHPIGWAWSTWARNREALAVIAAQDDFGPLKMEHLRSPQEVPSLLNRLAGASRA